MKANNSTSSFFRIACIFLLLACIGISCSRFKREKATSTLSIEPGKEDSIFLNLLALTKYTIADSLREDSLGFLILPLHASCPACRDKTIDSISSHTQDLPANRFIILSTYGGRKTFRSYFREHDKDLPVINGQLFLDSTNEAGKYLLYDKKPTFYYTSRRRAFKKIGALPATVRKDLNDFFSKK